jgi:hypothetical protein
MMDDSGNGLGVECRFDERTGILHIIVDGPLMEGKPSEGELLELIAHHRANRKLNGIVIFNKQDVNLTQYAEMLRVM